MLKIEFLLLSELWYYTNFHNENIINCSSLHFSLDLIMKSISFFGLELSPKRLLFNTVFFIGAASGICLEIVETVSVGTVTLALLVLVGAVTLARMVVLTGCSVTAVIDGLSADTDDA